MIDIIWKYLENWRKEVDYVILFCIVLLLVIGIILVATSSAFVALRVGLEPHYFLRKHILYMLFAVFFILFLSIIPARYIFLLVVWGFIVSILLMLLVFVVSPEYNGAKRWLSFFGFSLQPSEFTKVLLPVFFVLVWEYLRSLNYKDLIIYCLLGLVVICLSMIVLLQPDTGMAFVFITSFIIFLLITGININWFILLNILGVFAALFIYFLFPHVAYRINNFVLANQNYQISKALDAVANGGILGQGAGNGVFKGYIPDVHTDFILTVAVEEFGLLMLFIIIALYTTIIIRVFMRAFSQPRLYTMVCVSLTCVFFLQIIIHMAANINFIPTKGMVLPLISTGGSAFLANSMLLGILLNLIRKKKVPQSFDNNRNSIYANVT